MSPIKRKSILLASMALATLSACGAPDTAKQDAPGKPWAKKYDCDWWLSRDDGRSLRASIGQSDEGLLLSIADPKFLAWSEVDHPKVELRFNKDPNRRVMTEGWVSHVGKETSIFGTYLSAEALKAMSKATTLELHRDGKLMIELPLVDTPSQAELEACIRPPNTGSSDSE